MFKHAHHPNMFMFSTIYKPKKQLKEYSKMFTEINSEPLQASRELLSSKTRA